MTLRPFTTWAAQQIEKVLVRNDKRDKGPWERQALDSLMRKITEEYSELVDEYHKNDAEGILRESVDLAAAAMMIAAKQHPLMRLLRRGRFVGTDGRKA